MFVNYLYTFMDYTGETIYIIFQIIILSILVLIIWSEFNKDVKLFESILILVFGLVLSLLIYFKGFQGKGAVESVVYFTFFLNLLIFGVFRFLKILLKNS
jgi:hypothetical protein